MISVQMPIVTQVRVRPTLCWWHPVHAICVATDMSDRNGIRSSFNAACTASGVSHVCDLSTALCQLTVIILRSCKGCNTTFVAAVEVLGAVPQLQATKPWAPVVATTVKQRAALLCWNKDKRLVLRA